MGKDTGVGTRAEAESSMVRLPASAGQKKARRTLTTPAGRGSSAVMRCLRSPAREVTLKGKAPGIEVCARALVFQCVLLPRWHFVELVEGLLTNL